MALAPGGGAATGQALAYLWAWLAFPWLAQFLGRRVALGERGERVWIFSLTGLAGVALVSSAGMSSIPANMNLTAMLLVPGYVLATHRAVTRDKWAFGLCAVIILAALIADLRRTALISCLIATLLVIASAAPRKRAVLCLAVPAGILATAGLLGYLFASESAGAGERLIPRHNEAGEPPRGPARRKPGLRPPPARLARALVR